MDAGWMNTWMYGCGGGWMMMQGWINKKMDEGMDVGWWWMDGKHAMFTTLMSPRLFVLSFDIVLCSGDPRTVLSWTVASTLEGWRLAGKQLRHRLRRAGDVGYRQLYRPINFLNSTHRLRPFRYDAVSGGWVVALTGNGCFCSNTPTESDSRIKKYPPRKQQRIAGYYWTYCRYRVMFLSMV